MAGKLKLVSSNHNSYIPPSNLHASLKVAQVHEITFANEKALKSYRGMLYQINHQGEYKYRTLRADDHPYALVIWRMK